MPQVTLKTNIWNESEQKNKYTFPYLSTKAGKISVYPIEEQEMPAYSKITHVTYTIEYNSNGNASSGLWVQRKEDARDYYVHSNVFSKDVGSGTMDVSVNNISTVLGENSDIAITIYPVNPNATKKDSVNYKQLTNSNKPITSLVLTVEYEPLADPSHAVADTVDLGSTQLISIQTYVEGNRQDLSGLFHTVELTYGEGANEVSKTWEKTSSYVLAFTPTTDEISKLCNYNPTGTDLEGTLTVTTYSSADATTPIGQSWETKPHMTITDAVAGPKAIENSLDHKYKSDTPEAIKDTEKPYQNWSIFSVEPKFEWVNTQTGQITVTCTDGHITKTDSKTWTATPTVSGTYVITATATDVRGFTASYSWTVTLESCASPVFTRIDVHRCISTSNTDENDEGEYCYVNAAFITNGIGTQTNCSMVVTIMTMDSDSPYFEVNASITSDGNMVIGNAVLGSETKPLLKENNYRVKIVATDAITLSADIETTLGQAFYTVHRMAGGKGIAFGTISTTEGVTVNPDWPLYTHGQEIEHLILNAAHPIGSALETIDSGFNPSTLWPWTVWGRIATQTLDGMMVYLWVRAR